MMTKPFFHKITNLTFWSLLTWTCFSILPASVPGAEKNIQYEWLGASSYRIQATVEADKLTKEPDKGKPWLIPAEVRFDEDRILKYFQIDGAVNEDSIYVIAYDKQSGAPVIQDNKSAGEKKFFRPCRIFYRDAPKERKVIAWNDTVENYRNSVYFIYFDFLKGPRTDIYHNVSLTPIGAGEPFLADPGFLDVEFHSCHPLLLDWDNDGDLDILTTSCASGRGFLYFFENTSGSRNKFSFIAGKRLTYTNEEGGQDFFRGTDYGSILIDKQEKGTIEFTIQLGNLARKYVKTGEGRILFLGTKPASVLKAPEYDWDNDGVLETISPHWRNLKYAKGPVTQFLSDNSGQKIEVPEPIIGHVQIADALGTEKMDVFLGTSGGFMYLLRNAGLKNGTPVFYPPERMTGSRVPVTGGAITAPEVIDWDNDGNYDLLVGSECGVVSLYKNSGSNSKPVFVYQKFLEADGRMVEYPGDGRQNGDMFWGYAVPRAIDYDRDGLFDLVISESRGYQNVYHNIGTKKEPEFTFVGQIQADGKTFKPVWRVQPAFCDWNNDGRWDMVCADEEGKMCLYPGDSDKNLGPFVKKGYFTTPDNEKILCSHAPDTDDGKGGYLTSWGRTKYLVVDWDGDGKKDIVTREMGYFLFDRNISESPDKLLLDYPRPLKFLGEKLILNGGIGTHEDGFSLVDWNKDGRMDLVSGTEAGYICFFNHESLFSTSKLQTVSIEKKGERPKPYEVVLDRAAGVSKPYYLASKPRILFVHPDPEKGKPEMWYHPNQLREYFSTSSDIYGNWFKGILKTELQAVHSPEEFYAAWAKRGVYDILTFSYHGWVDTNWLSEWANQNKEEILAYVKNGGTIIASVGIDEEEIPFGKIFGLETTNRPGSLFSEDGLDFGNVPYTARDGADKPRKSRIDIAGDTPIGNGLTFVDTPDIGDKTLCGYGFVPPLPSWADYTAATVTDVKGVVHPVLVAGDFGKGKLIFYTAELHNPGNLQIVDGEVKEMTLLQLWRNIFTWVVSDKVKNSVKTGETIFFTTFDKWEPKNAIADEDTSGNWTQARVWCRRNTLYGDKSTPFLFHGPDGKNVPDISLPVRIEGTYDIYVGARSIAGPCRFQIGLSSEKDFFVLDPGTAQPGGDKNVRVSWKKNVRLDGTEKVILKYLGEFVYFDYLEFINK